MMPIKEILALKPIIPGPPVLVIDEKTIRETSDAGPVCGCQEKYNMIQEYKPFLPGGVNPYKRRKIPGRSLKKRHFFKFKFSTRTFKIF